MTRIRTLLAISIASLSAACAGAAQLGTGDDGTGGGADGGMDTGSSGSGSDAGTDDTQPSYPTQHPRIYLTPNRVRLTAALAAHTPAAMTMQHSVDAWVGGADLWGFQAWNAALLGQLTGSPQYCTKAVATIETQVATAEAAIAAHQAPVVAGDSYLAIGDMIGDLALVYDWCYDDVTPAQRTRWLAYADQAVFNVWHHSAAAWGVMTLPWTGWATDDASDNYYYSFLRATMLLGLATKGEDAAADGWIDQFRTTKILGELVPTFDADLVGGGSREGTGYGVAMRRLFELYDLWHATTGEVLASKTPHTRASMLSFMHQILPTADRVAPTGDQSRDSTASFFDYHRNYLQELVTLYAGDPLAGCGKTMLDQSSLPAMSSSFMYAYDFLYDLPVANQALDTLNTSYHAEGIGELYTRSGWDLHATWVNLIAGPYTESHAHQDQGSIMIYKDGWLAYDSVIDSHSGLTQDTTAHSLVRIDQGGSPVHQIASTTSTMQALHTGAGWLYSSADLTPAYNGNSAVTMSQRDMVYLQPDVVIVFDRVRSASGTTQTWQLATPVAPAISGSTATISAAHALTITEVAGGSMSVHSFASDPDYISGYRLDETAAGGDQRYLHVLGIDGAASAITGAGDATHPGVSLHLADGRNVTVTFERDSVGATLTIDGTTTPLGAGVDSLPE